MPNISLTEFIDFVIKAGSPKLTLVRQLMNRPDYSPATDYWKLMREGIQSFHSHGVSLDVIFNGLHYKKETRYQAAAKGYKKFLKKCEPHYFEPPRTNWSQSGLVVRVNPELGLVVDGEQYVIKLYFKDDSPSKHRLNAALQLMTIALGEKVKKGTKFAVLDVASSRLISGGALDPEFEILLISEAAAFVEMWTRLGAKKSVQTAKAAGA